jgi:hypothetical protein
LEEIPNPAARIFPEKAIGVKHVVISIHLSSGGRAAFSSAARRAVGDDAGFCSIELVRSVEEVDVNLGGSPPSLSFLDSSHPKPMLSKTTQDIDRPARVKLETENHFDPRSISHSDFCKSVPAILLALKKLLIRYYTITQMVLIGE